jgi:hypothetical protein
MANVQELAEMYEQDSMLRTNQLLGSLAHDVVLTAQAQLSAEGQSLPWIKSQAATLMGGRVAELVFNAAAKTGNVINERDLPSDMHVVLEETDGSFDQDSPISHLAHAATWSASLQVEDEIEDKGNRLWSTPVESLALRSGVISARLLESFGLVIDHEALTEALAIEDTWNYEEQKLEAEISASIRADVYMVKIMEELESIAKGKSLDEELESLVEALDT